MKKRYILILSMIFVILSISCVSAVDNDTDVFKEQNNDMISINEQLDDNISISKQDNEPIGLNNADNSSNLNGTDASEILTINEGSNVLSLSSDKPVLTSTVSITSASNYKEPTKKQRTFNIGGYKAVLSKAQYKKLFLISSTEDKWFDDGDYYTPGTKYHGYDQYDYGLRIIYQIKTNKFVKVKVKQGKKTYYKKARVYMMFTYGEGQCGVRYRHMAYLTHSCNTPKYDSAKVIGKKAKYFKKCKQSKDFTKLKSSKLYNTISVYKKYYK